MTIRPFSLTGSLSPLLLLPMMLPVISALIAPAGVLDMVPLARRLTLIIRDLLPGLPMWIHAESTQYPQVALLTHCLTISVLPLTSLVWTWQSIVNYPRLLELCIARGGHSWKSFLLSIAVGPPLILGGIYVFMALPGDPSFADGSTTRSRPMFAFLSFFAGYSASIIIGGQLLNIRLFIDTHFAKSD